MDQFTPVTEPVGDFKIQELYVDPALIVGTGFTPLSLRCPTGWMLCCFQHKENQLSISEVSSTKKGTMNAMIRYAIKKFGTNRIMFYNVLGPKLVAAVKGFEMSYVMDPVFGEPARVLKGVWNVE